VVQATFSRRELPDQAAVAFAGIDLPLEQARLVAVVLSRFVARGKSKTRDKTSQMTSGLVAACRLSVEREDEVLVAPHPGLRARGWPSGRTAMKHLGLDHRDIRDYWVRAKNRATDACLPLNWLLEFYPPDLWPAVLTLVSWGPERAAMWMEETVIFLAQEEIFRGARRRPAGSKISAGCIRTYVSGVWQVMDELVGLRARAESLGDGSLPRELLASWAYKPKRPDLEACGAREARLPAAGPPLDECATRLRELAADVDSRHVSHRYRALRRLLIFALLSLYGLRVDAIRTLKREDYLPGFVFGDGTRGPALRYFPAKTEPDDKPSYLPVPTELAERFDDWLRSTGGGDANPASPLFPSQRPGEEGPFLSRSGMYRLIAGKPSPGGSGSLALLPRADDRFTGWHPHAYRHTAFQGARRAGVLAKTDEPAEFASIEPNDFGHAITDHDLERDVAGTYLDIETHRQRLAGVAIAGAWSHLSGGGSRRGADLEEVCRTRAAVQELEAEVASMEADLRTLEERQSRLLARGRNSKGEALNKLTMRSNAVFVKSQVVKHNLEREQIRLAHAQGQFEVATAAQMPLPLDVTPEDFELRLALALGHNDGEAIEAPLADEITVSDVAELLDKTTQCINVWCRTGPPAGRPAPWRPGPDAWHVYNDKRKRLRVEAIDRSALSRRQLVRLTELRRRRAAVDASRTAARNRASRTSRLAMSVTT
jgi:integrase